MPSISTTALEVASAAVSATAEGSANSLGTASLPASTDLLVLAMGHARDTLSGQQTWLRFDAGGTTYSRACSSPSFGSSSHGAVDTECQLCAVFTYTSGASDELEWLSWCNDGGSAAASCQAYALDVSNIPEDDGRWHEESANGDTAVTTPGSGAGWTTLGTALTFTAPRSGDYLILVSAEGFANGTPASTDEFHTRVRQDSTEVSGSVSRNDVGNDTTDKVKGYGYAFVTTLTASTSYTFDVQANGTSANGNVSWRRVRIHAIEVAQIEDSDVQQDTDTDGETLVGFNVDGVADGINITLDPPASRDYLLLGCLQHQSTFWDVMRFRLGGATDVPANGINCAVHDTGIAASDDMTTVWMLHRVTGVSSSTSLQLHLDKPGGGSNNTYGADCASAGAGDMRVIALRLYTPDSSTSPIEGQADGSAAVSGTLTGDGALVGQSDGAATVTGDLGASGELAGQSDGTSTTTGDLGGTGALNGQSDGSSIVTGSLEGEGALSGQSDGTATVSGGALAVGVLSGTSDGSATVAGTLDGAGELAGQADGVGSGTAALTGSGALEGNSAGAATVAGSLGAESFISGTAAGTSAATAEGMLLGVLAGTSAGAATVSGDVEGSGALAGQSDGVGSASGELAGSGVLAGSAAGAATVTGSVTGYDVIDGQADGTSTATGQLLGTGALAGMAEGHASCTGEMRGAGVLSGMAEGTSGASLGVPFTWVYPFELAIKPTEGYGASVKDSTLGASAKQTKLTAVVHDG